MDLQKLKNMDLKSFRNEFDSPLDAGIAPLVKLMVDNDISTVQSCEGGDGHAYIRPTVELDCSEEDGWRALELAQAHGFKVYNLSRTWKFYTVLGEDGMIPRGPWWVMELS
jgi:hypothetical protein